MSWWHELPPVGEPIAIRPPQTNRAIAELFPDLHVAAYGSGTEALAAALAAALATTAKREPQVLIPAYACPNLVSAALWAGAKPVLVDLAPQRPWLDLQGIEQAIGPSTAAIVGVNFLGIPERLQALRALALRVGAVLIEDCAQAYPGGAQGDLTILSFGRGKPVSMLGGGLVITAHQELASHLPAPPSARGESTWRWRAKAMLHNALINPRLYGLARRAPFLHVGETRFAPLTHLGGGGSHLSKHLHANVDAYRSRSDVARRGIAALVGRLPAEAVVDLPRLCTGSEDLGVLRYPILVRDAELHATLVALLGEQGLGASTMYRSPLPEIAGLETMWRETAARYPNAKRFASELLTLPTHSGMGQTALARIGCVFETALGKWRTADRTPRPFPPPSA